MSDDLRATLSTLDPKVRDNLRRARICELFRRPQTFVVVL
jgi:hypothetical protein